MNARVACTGSNDLWLLCNESSLGLGEDSLWLWCNGLGGTVNNLSVLDRALDQPMIIATAENSIVDTLLAKIKVAVIASAAMVVLAWDSLVAMVAVNGEDTDSRGWSAIVVSDCVLAGLGDTRELRKPAVTSSSSTPSEDWNVTAW